MMIYLFALLGYLIGSIPSGLLLTKLAGYGDIRAIGSGNIGATNVLRTGNKKLAALTLLLDGGKGAAAVAVAYLWWHLAQNDLPYCPTINCVGDCPCSQNPPLSQTDIKSFETAAGFFAIIGHMFPVWLKFKGGKGVATTLGVYLAVAPWMGAVACAVWLAMAVVFRYSSLAALVALAAAPVAAHFIYNEPTLDAMCGVIAALVWFKHRANIKRLVRGEEPKIGKKKEA